MDHAPSSSGDQTASDAKDAKRPTDDALVGHLPDRPAGEALSQALVREAKLDPEQISHGGDPAFADWLQGSAEDDAGVTSRLGSWLTSLGQEREALVELGERVREGRHAIVVCGVEDEESKAGIVQLMERHGVQEIQWFGEWSTEEILQGEQRS